MKYFFLVKSPIIFLISPTWFTQFRFVFTNQLLRRHHLKGSVRLIEMYLFYKFNKFPILSAKNTHYPIKVREAGRRSLVPLLQ